METSAKLGTPTTLPVSETTPPPASPTTGQPGKRRSFAASAAALTLPQSRERTHSRDETGSQQSGEPGITMQHSAGGDAHQKHALFELFLQADRKRRGWISVAQSRRLLSTFGVTIDNSDMDELLREVNASKDDGQANSNQGDLLAGFSSTSAEFIMAQVANSFAGKSENRSSFSSDSDDDDAMGLSRGAFTPPGGASNESVSLQNLPYRSRSRMREQQFSFYQLWTDTAPTVLTTATTATLAHLRSMKLDGREGSPLMNSSAVEMEPIRLINVGPRSSDGPNQREDDATEEERPAKPGNTPRSAALLLSSLANGLFGMDDSGGNKDSPNKSKKAPASANPYHGVRISFEKFQKMVHVWESASHYRQFEDRSVATRLHLENATVTTLLLPDSTFIFFWQLLMLLVATCVLFAALITLTYDQRYVCRYLMLSAPVEIIATFLYFADIMVNFRTATIHKGMSGEIVVVDSPQSVAAEYLRFWFWIDVMALLPLRFFYIALGDSDFVLDVDPVTGAINAGSGCVGCHTITDFSYSLNVAKVLIMLRVLKYFAHFGYFQESRLMFITESYISRFFLFAQGITTVSILVVSVQVFTTLHMIIHPRTAAESLDYGGLLVARGYYLVLACFSGVGYGDITPTSITEEYYFMTLFVAAALFNGYVIGQAVSFFQRSDIASRKSESLLELLAMCEYFCVPEGLQNEVVGYYSHATSTDIFNGYSGLFDTLPTELHRGLELASRLRLIKTLPYFEELHRSARLLLCNCLVQTTYCPEEYIVYTGVIGQEMFFLNYGFVDIYGAGQKYLVTLRPGNYFGEMAIIDPIPQKRTADVKAITYCDVYILSKDSFQDIISKYPRLRVAVQELADARKKQNSAVAAPPPPPAATPPPAAVAITGSAANMQPRASTTLLALPVMVAGHGANSRPTSSRSHHKATDVEVEDLTQTDLHATVSATMKVKRSLSPRPGSALEGVGEGAISPNESGGLQLKLSPRAADQEAQRQQQEISALLDMLENELQDILTV